MEIVITLMGVGIAMLGWVAVDSMRGRKESEVPRYAQKDSKYTLAYILNERAPVYEAFDSGREYQDSTWGPVDHNLVEELALIRRICRDAEHNWCDTPGDGDVNYTRKIAAVAVRGIDQQEAAKRCVKNAPTKPYARVEVTTNIIAIAGLLNMLALDLVASASVFRRIMQGFSRKLTHKRVCIIGDKVLESPERVY